VQGGHDVAAEGGELGGIAEEGGLLDGELVEAGLEPAGPSAAISSDDVWSGTPRCAAVRWSQ